MTENVHYGKSGVSIIFFLSGENSFHGANKATGSSADTGVLQDHGNPTGKKLNIKIFEALMMHRMTWWR